MDSDGICNVVGDVELVTCAFNVVKRHMFEVLLNSALISTRYQFKDSVQLGEYFD